MDCAQTIAYYNGTISTIASGLKCKQWDSTDHRDKEMYPEKTVREAENYCRVIGERELPWCYTVKKEEGARYCDIPLCPVTGNKIL